MVRVITMPAPPPPATPPPAKESPRTISKRNALQADPLLQQLRRISRAAGVDVSITDTADEIRAKLQSVAHSPRQLTEALQEAQHYPTSMFHTVSLGSSMPPMPVRRAADLPSLASPDKRPDTAPAQLTSHYTPHTRAGFDFDWPSAYLPNHQMVSTPTTKLRYTTPGLTAAHAALQPPVQPARSAAGVGNGAQPATSPTKVQILGTSGIPVPSAADFLAADDSASELLTAAEPGTSAILSGVIASAERLELELAHATYEATTTSAKAVESARLEALRAHINGLRKVISQCPVNVMLMEKTRAKQLEKDVNGMKRQMTLAQQEIERLQHMLGISKKREVGAVFKRQTTQALIQTKAKSDQLFQEDIHARELAAYQAQLDHATTKAEETKKRLDDERERTATAMREATEEMERLRAEARAQREALEKALADKKAAEETAATLTAAAAERKVGKRGAGVAGGYGASNGAATGKNVVPPGGSVASDGTILDASGEPVMGADGEALMDGRVPDGGSIAADGTVLDADGDPVLDATGKPLVISTAPVVPEGGSIGADGRLLDANGKPLLDADGNPVTVSVEQRIPPGGSIGAGGVLLDKDGNAVLGADGKPQAVSDPRVPAGGSIGAGGVILDAKGQPVLGDDGEPLVVGRRSKKGQEGLEAKIKRKKVRNAEIGPAGRMLTLSRLRARDVPDMDRGGSGNNISDPYLKFTALDAKGDAVDDARTPHLENARHCKWDETLRLFYPDDDAKSTRTKTYKVLVTLMDRNKKKADELIGELKMELKCGTGRIKVELPSRSVSSMRPYVYFKYHATPQMFYERVEWVRVESVEDGKPKEEPEGEDTPGAEESPGPARAAE